MKFKLIEQLTQLKIVSRQAQLVRLLSQWRHTVYVFLLRFFLFLRSLLHFWVDSFWVYSFNVLSSFLMLSSLAAQQWISVQWNNFQNFQVLYLGPKIFFCPNLICTGLKIYSSTVCKDSAKYRGGTYSCSKPSITTSIKSHTTWTLPYAWLSVNITANLAVTLQLT